MAKPDRDAERSAVDAEAAEQGQIDDLDLSPPEKVAARDAVRKELDEELDTGRAPTPAHE